MQAGSLNDFAFTLSVSLSVLKERRISQARKTELEALRSVIVSYYETFWRTTWTGVGCVTLAGS